MKRIGSLLVFLLLIFMEKPVMATVNVEARVDTTQAEQGEEIRLEITVNSEDARDKLQKNQTYDAYTNRDR